MDLITFCASHISLESRIPLLKNAIESVLNQLHKTCLFVSISYNKIELESQLETMIAQQCATNEYIKVYLHPKKQLSQFEHYNFLIERIDPLFYNRTWVMFMDDDDFSHNLRTTWYHIYKKNKDQSCKSIINPYIVIFKNDHNKLPTYSECSNALQTGRSNVISSREYVAYCVRLNLLHGFTMILKKHKVLNTPLCDVVFGSVLYNITNEYHWTEMALWAYAYNQHSSTDRMTKKYGLQYYKRTYSKTLFKDLATTFKITKWIVRPGYTSIWGDKPSFKSVLVKNMNWVIRITSCMFLLKKTI